MPKRTSTHRVHAFRERQNSTKPPKSAPKSAVLRLREFRARKKTLKDGSSSLSATLSDGYFADNPTKLSTNKWSNKDDSNPGTASSSNHSELSFINSDLLEMKKESSIDIEPDSLAANLMDSSNIKLECPELVILRCDPHNLHPEEGPEYCDENISCVETKIVKEEILADFLPPESITIKLKNEIKTEDVQGHLTISSEPETIHTPNHNETTNDQQNDFDSNDDSSKSSSNEFTDKFRPVPRYDATGKRVYNCDICDRPFVHSSHVRRHRMIHSNLKQFQCCHCGGNYKTLRTLQYHERSHSTEQRHICKSCGREFATDELLQEHKKTHIGSCVCDICERTFNKKFAMMRHRKTHTGQRSFKCVECDATFIEKASFIAHCRKHTGERPFPCHLCFKRFRRKTNLTGHMRTHTEERAHKCDVCARCFGRKPDLVRHMVRVHKMVLRNGKMEFDHEDGVEKDDGDRFEGELGVIEMEAVMP